MTVTNRQELFVVTVRSSSDAGPGRVLAALPASSSDRAVASFHAAYARLYPRSPPLPHLGRDERFQALPARVVPGELRAGRTWREKPVGCWLYAPDELAHKVRTYGRELAARLARGMAPARTAGTRTGKRG